VAVSFVGPDLITVNS